MTERDTIGHAFKQKASENYRVACLVLKTAPNAAANRCYYALYQALVGEFEAQGLKPETVDPLAKSATRDEEKKKWRHAVAIQNGRLAGLSGRECTVLRAAYGLRITADYDTESVSVDFAEQILRQSREILEGLGVNIH